MIQEISNGLHHGSLFFSEIGHNDYGSKDILGTTVNAAFRIEALESSTGIKSSINLVKQADFKRYTNLETVTLKGLEGSIEVCDIKID
ncbi:MAG: hypothetical protein PF447_14620 [Spirochaetaceae bacterium]|jgi:class 3 adenylate cyclase|nr:hypothetical protein [Spirochaetaceae bacterium]